MTASEIRKVLERHWYYAGKDEAISNEMYDEDAVLEFPQSGERFRGRANFQVWRERYPASFTMEIRRLRGAGDFWVAENLITYEDEDTWQTVSILEIREGRIVREAIYFAKPFPAPEWRSQWVDREPTDGATGAPSA